MAGATTAAAVIALTIYAWVTDINFEFCAAILIVSLVVVLIGSLVGMFYHAVWWHTMISIAVVILFCCYIVFDTQMIIGKNSSLEIDEYVFAAMMLYIDIVYLFLEIQKLMGSD